MKKYLGMINYKKGKGEIMKAYYETKIGKIIAKESDARMDGAILTYIIDKGWENVKEITDKQINELEGNGLMTQRFVQSLVRAARRITKECDMYKDFLSYIRLHVGINGYQTNELTLYKEDYTEDGWSEVLHDLDLDYEEPIESIEVSAVVGEIRYSK